MNVRRLCSVVCESARRLDRSARRMLPFKSQRLGSVLGSSKRGDIDFTAFVPMGPKKAPPGGGVIRSPDYDSGSEHSSLDGDSDASSDSPLGPESARSSAAPVHRVHGLSLIHI